MAGITTCSSHLPVAPPAQPAPAVVQPIQLDDGSIQRLAGAVRGEPETQEQKIKRLEQRLKDQGEHEQERRLHNYIDRMVGHSNQQMTIVALSMSVAAAFVMGLIIKTGGFK
jgi:hypothetical protein